jgi:hypothetical protein
VRWPASARGYADNCAAVLAEPSVLRCRGGRRLAASPEPTSCSTASPAISTPPDGVRRRWCCSPAQRPKGGHDPRVQQVSRALAGAGRTVFVPDLELSRTTFDRIDIDRVVPVGPGAARAQPAAGGVAVLGFSYGGSLALVAAADPRVRPAGVGRDVRLLLRPGRRDPGGDDRALDGRRRRAPVAGAPTGRPGHA